MRQSVHIAAGTPATTADTGTFRAREKMCFMAFDEWAKDVECAAQLLGRPSLAFRRRLTGGEHARTVVAGDGYGDVVLRRFPPGDAAGEHELLVTERLAALDGLAPRLLASAASHTDGALLVNELIDGTAPGAVSDQDLATGLAQALARVHQITGRGLREAPAQGPSGDSRIAIAGLARDRFARLDLSERVLTHYDFWTGNTLWKRRTLVGVVDWSGARSAPRGVDLAWARLDLILQGRPQAAQMFLDHYRDATGVCVADIREWDLQAAAQAVDAVGTWSPNYVGIGLADLTADRLTTRMAAWIERLLANLGI